DGEADRLALVDEVDVGLVDLGPQLDLLEVLGDQEQARGVEAGDDGLADVDPAVDDDALDRRLDGAVAEVGLRLLEGSLSSLAHAAHADHVALGVLEGLLRLDEGRLTAAY